MIAMTKLGSRGESIVYSKLDRSTKQLKPESSHLGETQMTQPMTARDKSLNPRLRSPLRKKKYHLSLLCLTWMTSDLKICILKKKEEVYPWTHSKISCSLLFSLPKSSSQHQLSNHPQWCNPQSINLSQSLKISAAKNCQWLASNSTRIKLICKSSEDQPVQKSMVAQIGMELTIR